MFKVLHFRVKQLNKLRIILYIKKKGMQEKLYISVVYLMCLNIFNSMYTHKLLNDKNVL